MLQEEIKSLRMSLEMVLEIQEQKKVVDILKADSVLKGTCAHSNMKLHIKIKHQRAIVAKIAYIFHLKER